jgi:voltage-gated potassium channel Kch
VAGDATDADVLRRAEAATCSLALVTVPNDAVARQIVKTLRRLNRTCAILVRCRYQSNVAGMKLTGADAVVSEESEATAGLLRLLERVQEKGGGVPGSGLRT